MYYSFLSIRLRISYFYTFNGNNIWEMTFIKLLKNTWAVLLLKSFRLRGGGGRWVVPSSSTQG